MLWASCKFKCHYDSLKILSKSPPQEYKLTFYRINVWKMARYISFKSLWTCAQDQFKVEPGHFSSEYFLKKVFKPILRAKTSKNDCNSARTEPPTNHEFVHSMTAFHPWVALWNQLALRVYYSLLPLPPLWIVSIIKCEWEVLNREPLQNNISTSQSLLYITTLHK